MMILPPGGFLTLGLLLAVRKRIEMRRKVHGTVTANAQPGHCGA